MAATQRRWTANVGGAALVVGGGFAVNQISGSWVTMTAWFMLAVAILLAANAVASRAGEQRATPRLLVGKGRLPMAAQISLRDLRVHASKFGGDQAYVRREVDGALLAALRDPGRRLVILSAPALAGASRTLAQGLKAAQPEILVAAFPAQSGFALEQRIRSARRYARGRQVVVWLDAPMSLAELSEAADVREAAFPDVRVVGCVDPTLLNPLVLPVELEPLAREIEGLSLGTLSDVERARVAEVDAYRPLLEAYSGSAMLLGQLLTSFEAVEAALSARTPSQYDMVACVRAAVDWQRLEVPLPLTRRTLEQLAPAYLAGLVGVESGAAPASGGGSSSSSSSRIDRALIAASAVRPGLDHPLIEIFARRRKDDRYAAHRLVVAFAQAGESAAAWPPAEALVEYLEVNLAGKDRRRVGLTSCAHGHLLVASRLLLGDSGLEPDVMSALAAADYSARAWDRARQWWRALAATGHIDQAPRAMVNLGVLEAEQGRVEEARSAYRQAIETGHTAYAPVAMVYLGVLEQAQGNIGQARSAFELAVATGHADLAPNAMSRLGGLEQAEGRLGEARSNYQRAIATGHTDEAPRAMVFLGKLERGQGRAEQARSAYEQAITSGHSEYAPMAMVNLGTLEAELGHVEQARSAYEQAIATGHADEAPKAMINLGMLEVGQDRVEQARSAYGQAIATGHVDEAPRAMVCLGRLERGQGRAEQARSAYEKAIANGHPEYAPQAMVDLGVLEANQGHVEQARSAFNLAIATGHADETPAAMFSLGVLEGRQGRVEHARSAYEKAIANGHLEYAPMAMLNLGALEAGYGFVGQARSAYEKAIANGHPEYAPMAMVNLGALEADQGRIEQAHSAFEKALNMGSPAVVHRAQQLLRKLDRQRDEHERVERFARHGWRAHVDPQLMQRDPGPLAAEETQADPEAPPSTEED